MQKLFEVSFVWLDHVVKAQGDGEKTVTIVEASKGGRVIDLENPDLDLVKQLFRSEAANRLAVERIAALIHRGDE